MASFGRPKFLLRTTEESRDIQQQSSAGTGLLDEGRRWDVRQSQKYIRGHDDHALFFQRIAGIEDVILKSLRRLFAISDQLADRIGSCLEGDVCRERCAEIGCHSATAIRERKCAPGREPPAANTITEIAATRERLP